MFGCTFTSFSYTIYTKFHVLLNCSDTNLLLWNNRSYLFFHTVSFIWQYGTTLPLLKFNSLLILILSYPNIITSTDLLQLIGIALSTMPSKETYSFYLILTWFNPNIPNCYRDIGPSYLVNSFKFASPNYPFLYIRSNIF